MSAPEKGFFSETVISLEEALDTHPCKHCGRHYNEHLTLVQEDIDNARAEGAVVEICDKRILHSFDEEGYEKDKAYFCTVTMPPDEPCDEDFMKEIST